MTQYNYYYNRQSWKCTGCGTQWAPHVDKCSNCSPTSGYNTSGYLRVLHAYDDSGSMCCVLHYDNNGNQYSCMRCKNCGKHMSPYEFATTDCNLNPAPTIISSAWQAYIPPSNFVLKTYNENVDKFIEDTIKKTIDNNIKFIVSLADYVKFGNSDTKSNGYFVDGDAPELAFSFKGDYSIWLTTLIHESCHMDQYLEGSPLWKSLEIEADGEPQDEDLIFDWIDGKEADPTILGTLIRNTKYMELDCEKRVVEKIKEYNLPLDIPTYTKRANAYTLFYNYMQSNRAWYVIQKEPYNDEKILALMSDKFDMNYDELTDELKELFAECCRKE